MSRGAVELLPGTLDLLILKTLTLGPQHGYAILRQIYEVTDAVLQIEEGSLYPALHRMESRGWLTASWAASENNRKAKFYRLNRAGQRRLEAKASAFKKFTDATHKVLALTPEGA